MNRLSIGKVTARTTTRADPLTTRLRLAHLLQSADITPPCFPPHAILLLRRAAARQKVSLASFQLRPEWEREMRAVVADFLRRAVVPVHGFIPMGAEAVLFRDEAEWLACLGLHVAARTVESAWYCRAMLGPRAAVSTPLTLARAFAAQPRNVPAALAYLARWRGVASVLRLLAPREVEMVWTPLAYEWGLAREGWLPEDTRPPAFADDETDADRQTTPRAVSAHAAERARPTKDEAEPRLHQTEHAPNKLVLRPVPRWTNWLTHERAECTQLAPATQRLLYVALMLAHEPTRARSGDFIAQVRAALQTPDLQSHAPATRSTVAQSNEFETKAQQSDELQPATMAEAVPLDERHAGEDGPAWADDHERADRAAVASSVVKETAEASAAVDAVAEEAAAASDTSARPWDNLAGFETELGGALFLLNIFQLADLPRCFDEDFNLSAHINGWGLAELFARVLLGDSYVFYRADPMWEMLEHLDGRAPGITPAPQLPPPDTYRLPAAWLKRFLPAEDEWAIETDAARVVARHARAGFVIFERPHDGRSFDEVVAAELERYRARGVAPSVVWRDESSAATHTADESELLVARVWPELAAPVGRWLSWTFPFIRFLLARVFGVEAELDQQVARRLLVRQARVYCTATHVDVVLSMEQIDLAVRRAGLDATPGWVRDLARVVTIHFD